MTMLQTATSELGVVEGKGSANDPRVLEYHKASGGFSQDSVPWCGSFVAWCAQQNHVPYTKYKAAAAKYWITDWITEGNGKLIKNPIPGAIGVKSRQGGNHVFFFVRWLDKSAGLFEALGGNQGGGKASGHDGAVTLTKFSAHDVLGWAWPVSVPLPMASKPYRKSESVIGGSVIGGTGLVTAATVAPDLGKAISILNKTPQDTVAEVVQDSGGNLVEAVHKSADARATGTIFGAVVAVVIIAAAVWIIVSRINNARKERAELEA